MDNILLDEKGGWEYIPDLNKYLQALDISDSAGMYVVFGPYPGTFQKVNSIKYTTCDTYYGDTYICFYFYAAFSAYPCIVPPTAQEEYYSFYKSVSFGVTNFDKLKENGISAITEISISLSENSYDKGSYIIIGKNKSRDSGIPLRKYKQAEGVLGVIGKHISESYNVYDFDRIDQLQSPVLMDSNIYINDFYSKLAIMQMVITKFAEPANLHEDVIFSGKIYKE